MTSQFVILHHRLPGNEHWDLMLEYGDVLLTWQLLADPTAADAIWPIDARRIGNHRKTYLDYEGPIAGGRGEVRRVDRGPVEIQQLTDDKCDFTVAGRRLRRDFTLRRSTGDRWTFEALRLSTETTEHPL